MKEIIEVTEKLYREANPNTNEDIPSFAYEKIETADKRRIKAKRELSLYDWCKQELKQKQDEHR